MENKITLKSSIPEELICDICLDFLRQPKVLWCAHTFCQCCLQGILEQGCLKTAQQGEGEIATEGAGDGGEEGSGGEMGSESTGSESVCIEIECPSCGVVTHVPEEGIQDLTTHSRLESLVSDVLDSEKRRVRQVLHERMAVARSLTTQMLPKCSKHEKALLEYFCNQCTEVLCMQCLKNGHLEHDYKDVIKVLPVHFAALRSHIQPAYEFLEKASSMIEQFAKDHDTIETNQKMCKESVQEVFSKLRNALDHREKLLLLTIDKYATAKLDAVAEQQQKTNESKQKIIHCVETMSKLLERPGDIAVLQEDQEPIKELDNQEQVILDVDNEASLSMHSSSYVGFREDHVPVILQEAPKALALCEFYPESDSGYYASRQIVVDGDEEDVYDSVRHRGNLRYKQSMHHIAKPDVKQREPIYESDSSTPYDSPCTSRRSSFAATDNDSQVTGATDNESPQVIKITDSDPSQVAGTTDGDFPQTTEATDEDLQVIEAPITPVRFSSILAPLPILEPLKVFDKLGKSRKESVNPCGLCIIANDSIIVSDVKNHCLRMIASNGKYIDKIGSEGKGSGMFEEPCGVCIGGRGYILVSQKQNPRIQKFTSSGKYLGKFGQKSLRGSSTFGEPWGVCASPNGEIYVSDWDKSCIHIFQDSGRYACMLGSKKAGVGVKESLLFPGGIACDSHGQIYVADRGNHCIWLLQPDGSITNRLGTKGHGPGDLYYPYGVAVTADGRIVVSESGNHRISIFSPSGEFERCFGRKGGRPGFFDHPRYMDFTSKGDLVVADEINERLQVFRLS